MHRLKAALEAETPIADVELSDEDAHLLRGFQFLTAKPALVVVNLGEDGSDGFDMAALARHKHTSALELRGTLEMEIAQLPADEMALFLQSYDIAEPGLNVLVRESYELLGLMSFFTVGEDEVRAWTVRRGATAVEAAGAIHSDLARGFIRAEVISYDDMIACGTMAEARSRASCAWRARIMSCRTATSSISASTSRRPQQRAVLARWFVSRPVLMRHCLQASAGIHIRSEQDPF